MAGIIDGTKIAQHDLSSIGRTSRGATWKRPTQPISRCIPMMIAARAALLSKRKKARAGKVAAQQDRPSSPTL